MSVDAETMAVYAGAARQYAEMTLPRPEDRMFDPDLTAFLARIPKGGRVLDLGCGPGHWAAQMRDAGFEVDAVDASPEMVELAQNDHSLDARVALFEDLPSRATYDGIWANFSLLHAPKSAFPDHLARVHAALKPGGTFHIGMKLGEDEGRDRLGRFFSYYREDELHDLLQQAGFTPRQSRRGNGKGLAGGEETYVVVLSDA